MYMSTGRSRMAPMHPIVEAMKVKTPIIIRPMAGVIKTTVGNVVCPGSVSQEQPTGSGVLRRTVSAHF